MQPSVLLLILLAAMAVAYRIGSKRAVAVAGGASRIKTLHSLPNYYGFYAALWTGLPALLLLGFWIGFQDTIILALVEAQLPAEMTKDLSGGRLSLLVSDIKSLAGGRILSGDVTPELQAAAAQYARLQQIANMSLWSVAIALAIGGMVIARGQISPRLRARNRVEAAILVIMIVCSSIAILTTLGIVLSVVFESIRFFQKVEWTEFFFGLEWSPQTALRADQVGSDGLFGAVPLFAGTLLVSLVAMLIAVPIGLMSAIYLAEYAHGKVRAWAKPMLEILAGIPTVVYGFFAALTVAPFIRGLGERMGLDVSSESALAAGFVMGIMIIPFVSSLSDDVINAVPQAMRDGSYALGATQSETVKRVIFPAALPGIVGGVLLAVSRAIGEMDQIFTNPRHRLTEDYITGRFG